MNLEDIEDHPPLLQKVAAALNIDRGFIALRISALEVPAQFTATYNFDASLYQDHSQERINAETVRKPFSKNEYVHLQEILTPLLLNPAPLITLNFSSDYTTGSLLPWILRSVMILPIPNEIQASALLWCDRKITRREWTEADLTYVATLIQQFYMPADNDTESFVP